MSSPVLQVSRIYWTARSSSGGIHIPSFPWQPAGHVGGFWVWTRGSELVWCESQPARLGSSSSGLTFSFCETVKLKLSLKTLRNKTFLSSFQTFWLVLWLLCSFFIEWIFCFKQKTFLYFYSWMSACFPAPQHDTATSNNHFHSFINFSCYCGETAPFLPRLTFELSRRFSVGPVFSLWTFSPILPETHWQ